MIRDASIISSCLPEEEGSSRAGAGLKRPAAGFTLIELLVVITIIVILATMTLPAIKALTKSNDQSQSVNLVKSMISTARSIAISQHREAGVVFFEETTKRALPYNGGRTAMQLFVEDFNQSQYAGVPSGGTVFVMYSPARQYLPAGIKIATLATDASAGGANVQAGDTTLAPRAIIFDANGQLVVRNGLCVQSPGGTTTAGVYPYAYGDWNFFAIGPAAPGGIAYSSSPGFFVYSQAEYDQQPPASQALWIQQHADVILVNANTGGVLQ